MAQTVSLVLGSGGARGYAHIGVIEALNEAGLEIRAISGSSMGALIGGLYANGNLEEYKEWVLSLALFDILRLVDLTFSSTGLIKGDRVFNRMAYLIGDTLIEDLPMPYTAVATDIINRREVWLQQGSLKTAIRASIAIPMVFDPVWVHDRLLIDGGVLNPLPVAPTMSYQTDITVAVDVNAETTPSQPLHHHAEGEAATYRDEEQGEGFWSSIGLAGSKKQRLRMRRMGMLELVNRAMETMQQSLSHYKTAGYPPDLVIRVPAAVRNFYDFHCAEELIDLGRTATFQALERQQQERALIPDYPPSSE